MDLASVRNDEKQSAVADLLFVRDFVRMCSDGYAMGWHERNGGNASYRLRAEERAAVGGTLGGVAKVEERAGIAELAGEGVLLGEGTPCATPWLSLDVEAANLDGEWLLITATGSYMRNVADQPEKALGIVELRATASALMEYRVVWGFEGGGRPTSELSAHVLIHAVKKRASQGESRVLYHCHPTPIIALTHVFPHDARVISRLLWRTMTECVMVFPQGVGIVPCEVPGSMELARLTAEQVESHDAVIWVQHGLLATGESCDAAFGLMHVIVKAAQIYETACVMAGGPENLHLIPEEELPRLAAGLGVSLNESFIA